MGSNFSIKILNPSDPTGAMIEAIIPYKLSLAYYKYYPTRYENLRTAKYVLENPKRIFSGVRQFNEGGFCFTAKPVSWYISGTVSAPFPDGLVYAVYLNSRFYIYEARAEPCDDGDKLCPENWQDRYGALIWKSTS